MGIVVRILSIPLLLLCFFSSLAMGEEKIPSPVVRVGAQLFSWKNSDLLAVNFSNHPHWHTYWKNPGDSGRPIQVELSGIALTPLEWPRPRRFVEPGNIIVYGYSGDYTLFFEMDPEDYGERQNRPLSLSVKWLVCKHICLPEKIEIVVKFQDGKLIGQGATLEKVTEATLKLRREQLPGPVDYPEEMGLTLVREEKGLALYYQVTQGKTRFFLPKDLNILTPLPHKLLTFKHEKLFVDDGGEVYGRMDLDWDGEYSEPAIELPADGRFLPTPLSLSFLYVDPYSGKMGIVGKSFESFTSQGSIDYSAFSPLSHEGMVSVADGSSTKGDDFSQSVWIYILFAFLGGLILNIMPCVLPVISLKLFGLINVRERDRNAILRHNLIYTAGVLFTFAVLGFMIVGLQYAGQSVGWGFHLQSPRFIVVMVMILLVLTLNLFGLFEFKTPGGRVLGDFHPRRGLVGDFLSGVLATALSTPCSAPFLGTALTFAFLSSPWTLFLIFFFIGLGLSFPFLLTAIVPDLIYKLPRPGVWMEHCKKFLGLTLLLSIVWLMDILGTLADTDYTLAKINVALVFTFFAFYFQKYISKKMIWRIVVFIVPVGILLSVLMVPIGSMRDSDKLLRQKNSLGLNWEKWSTERMEEYKTQGKNVFISFTAEWCLTCKANERLVINTKSFEDIVREYDIKLLLADFTKQNEVMSKFLRQNGLVGIPAYFIQKSDGALINLRETITLGKLRKHFQQ